MPLSPGRLCVKPNALRHYKFPAELQDRIPEDYSRLTAAAFDELIEKGRGSFRVPGGWWAIRPLPRSY